MIVILDKRAEVAAIKNEILEFIGATQPTFPEIYAKYSNFQRHTVSNWLVSLKRVGLIDMVGEGRGFMGKKYIRISDKKFTEVIHQRIEENNKKRAEAYQKKKAELKVNPYARVYRMEDFKVRAKANKTKINPWQGYTSFSEAV